MKMSFCYNKYSFAKSESCQIFKQTNWFFFKLNRDGKMILCIPMQIISEYKKTNRKLNIKHC